ncbi:glycosyltransferase [Brevibacterium salitolerans]|uniref:Glycosyltransferase like family 2 n=1 Tax=Brevibacterium salitolerans TaxID=1403566 RepID=A0ABN2WFJ5_9MICO
MSAPADYLLPLRWQAGEQHGEALADLVGYLSGLPGDVRVTVVDGSPPGLRALHAAALPAHVRHLPAAQVPAANGKVIGVLTALPRLTRRALVIADDDVRYTEEGLGEVLRRLDRADMIVPQNVFTTADGSPLPWHARWDTARSLLNRAFGTDYPGTLAVRRELLDGGYDPHVLFENLELIRTVRARGGRVECGRDVYVPRRPPTVRRFWEQRVRQAYDSRAQPVRRAAELLLVPLVLLALRRPPLLLCCALGAIALAECGRRRDGGASAFPAGSALWAPVWLLERGVCAWIALAAGMRGGIGYRGSRLHIAAHSEGWLRRRERGYCDEDAWKPAHEEEQA